MKHLKQNRMASFAIVTLIYIFAALIGIFVYNMLSFGWWLNLLAADIAATAVTFAFSAIFDNASVNPVYCYKASRSSFL